MVHVMSLAEVALLAQVDRSVVAHWRTRMARRTPFPPPVADDSGREFFSCDDVVAWLEATGLGNNRQAAEHVIAFHLGGRRVLSDAALFHGLSALLCLRALAGHLPADPDSLVDLTDEMDPDDEFLLAEVDAVRDDLPALAAYASLLVRDSFDVATPFDHLMAGRRTTDRPAAWRVAPALAKLSLDLAMAVADEAGFETPVLCLPRPQDVVLLATLPDWADGRPGIGVALSLDPALPEARLARRWLAAHRVPVRPLTASDGSALPDEAVALARLDDVDRGADLAWLNEFILQRSPAMRAVVVGRAGALVGSLRVPRRGRPPASGAPLTPAGEERREALRSGWTRAVLRLPAGLLPDNQAQKSAIWCLGPASDPPVTYCVDVAGPLVAVASGLVSDVVAAYGAAGARGRGTPGRYVRQAELEMRDGDLVASVDPRLAPTQGVLRRLDDLAPAAGLAVQAPWSLEVQARGSVGLVQRMTLGEAVAARHAEIVGGVSIDADDLVASPDVPVVTAPDDLLARDHVAGLKFATLTRYGHAQLTQPGDIVFVPGAVRVDALGGVLVASPARVLRCWVPPVRTPDQVEKDERAGRHQRPQRLVPELLAAELTAAASRKRDWKAWEVTLLPVDRVEDAVNVGAALAEHRRQLEAALATNHDLMSTLASALGGDLCTITITERKTA